MKENTEYLSFPIGHYQQPEKRTILLQQEWITDIEALPDLLYNCCGHLDEEKMKTPYRYGGWTALQVIHHVADVHMNAYIRLKLALTEDNPVVKPYDEKCWADLPDCVMVPANVSIALLQGLHTRWVSALRNMKSGDWDRTYHHPQQKRDVPLWELVALYAWHGRHHLSQVKRLRERMHW